MAELQARYGEVSITCEKHVAVLKWSRPPANFITVGVLRDLADAIEAVDGEREIRASVICTEGKVFSAGADLVAGDALPAGLATTNPLYDQVVRLVSTAKPIVAAVQGPAVGAGFGLALVADFRVAAPEARFAANFVKLGFHPGFGITHLLPRVVGQQKAALICLTGRRVRADEALAWGLVDDLAPLAELRVTALRLAVEIAENAPLAVQSTRATLRADLAAEVRAQTDHEHAEQTRLRATADFAEGVRAVNERRPGNFIGA